jgi:hypothetical protein
MVGCFFADMVRITVTTAGTANLEIYFGVFLMYLFVD